MQECLTPGELDCMAAVIEMAEAGHNTMEISEATGVHRDTVVGIIERTGTYREYNAKTTAMLETQLSPEQWESRFAALADKHATVAELALEQATEILSGNSDPAKGLSLDNTTAKDYAALHSAGSQRLKTAQGLAIAAAVATDKASLLTGRATSRASIDVESTSFRDAVALRERIMAMNPQSNVIEANVIDLTPSE